MDLPSASCRQSRRPISCQWDPTWWRSPHSRASMIKIKYINMTHSIGYLFDWFNDRDNKIMYSLWMHLKSINNFHQKLQWARARIRISYLTMLYEQKCIQMVSITLPVRKLIHRSAALPCVPGRSWQVCPDPAYTHGCTCLCYRRQTCCCSASPHPEQVLLGGRDRELRAAAAEKYCM